MWKDTGMALNMFWTFLVVYLYFAQSSNLVIVNLQKKEPSYMVPCKHKAATISNLRVSATVWCIIVVGQWMMTTNNIYIKDNSKFRLG